MGILTKSNVGINPRVIHENQIFGTNICPFPWFYFNKQGGKITWVLSNNCQVAKFNPKRRSAFAQDIE